MENKVHPSNNRCFIPPDHFPGEQALPDVGNYFYVVENIIYLRGQFDTMPLYWGKFTRSLRPVDRDKIRNALREQYNVAYYKNSSAIWRIEFPEDKLIKFILDWS